MLITRFRCFFPRRCSPLLSPHEHVHGQGTLNMLELDTLLNTGNMSAVFRPGKKVKSQGAWLGTARPGERVGPPGILKM